MSEICISFDDVKGIFKALSSGYCDSIFDTRTLSFLQGMHNKYGTAFELYCTCNDGKYSLSDISDKYKEEFQYNSSWLKFGFHCVEENLQLRDMDQLEFSQLIDEFFDNIKRITGQKEIIDRLRLHGFAGNINVCKILRQYGIKTILASDDNRLNYYLTEEQNEMLLNNGNYYDDIEDIEFVCSCPRLENSSDIEAQIRNRLTSGCEIIPVFTHEWKMDDEIVRNRIEICCKLEKEIRTLEYR